MAPRAPIYTTAPFLRLLLPLAAGILLGWYLPAVPWQLWAAVAALSLLAMYWQHYRVGRYTLGFALALTLFFTGIGAALTCLHHTARHPQYIGHHYQPGMLVQATITKPPIPKPKSYRAEAAIALWDSTQQRWQPVQGHCILYLSKEEVDTPPPTGSVLRLQKTLQRIPNSGNPGAFDYATFSARNHLYYQVFLRQHEYSVAGKASGYGLQQWMHAAQMRLVHTIRQYVPDSTARGIAMALLAGYREEMDKEVAVQYASTGVAHIIAISGLHLGLVQQALLLLLSPLLWLKNGKALRIVLVIIALWLFAGLTGGSPSVLRAALMFSLLLTAQAFGRSGSTYNSLAIAAFVLLIYDPFLLWNVGFQLSFAAVLSILIFSHPIAKLYTFDAPLLQQQWELVSVTLAAQVLTLPFVVYYFQQFPLYFLPANMVAVPLTALLLYALLLLGFGVSWWPWAAEGLGHAIAAGIGGLNRFISWVHQLPWSRVEGIYLTVPQAILWMLAIAALGMWWLQKQKGALIAALVSLLLYAGSLLYRQYHIERQHALIVYQVPGLSAIDYWKGSHAYYYGDSTANRPGMQYKMNVQPARIQGGIAHVHTLQPPGVGITQLRAGHLRVVVAHAAPDTARSRRVEADVVVLTGNSHRNPNLWLQLVNCPTWVADATVPYYQVQRWQSAADSLHLRFHAVGAQGAFVLRLPP